MAVFQLPVLTWAARIKKQMSLFVETNKPARSMGVHN